MMKVAAQTYQRMGKYAEMEGVLQGLLVMEPRDPWVLSALGFALHHQNKLDEAVEAYERAIELSDGAEAGAAVNLVGVLLMLGQTDRAITELERLVARDDPRPEIREALARIEQAIAACPAREEGDGSSEDPAD